MSDNTTASARNIGTLGATTRTFNDFVGSSDSSDYYRFSIDGTRNLRLALSGLSADADMDLRASNGTTILRKATRAGSQSESIDFDKLAAGTYYVRVYQGTGTANTNYQLSLSAQAVAPPVISDNTAATARNIGTLGAATLTFKDSVGSSDSSDYYRFNIDGTRKLRVALSGLSADADMELRASNGTSVLRSSVRTGSQSEAIDFDNFAAGTYYVRVYQGTSTANTNYQLALSAQAVASPVISITALNATRSEGNNGSTPFTFTVSRSNGTGSSTVSYAVSGAADGSYNAASGNDFIGGTLPSRVLSFAAGETSQTLTINVAGDTTVESNERFKVTLSSPTNATLGTTAAYGHINNDDNVQATLGLAAPQSALLATLKSRFDSATTRIAYDAAVNDANLYPSNSKYAGFNGECVSYVKRARTNLNFFWDNAKGGAGAAKGQNFHVDVIPMIGSAFVVSAANRDVPPYEAGSFGHTGIVRDVQVVRNNAGSNVTYSYSLKLRDSNREGDSLMRDGTASLHFPSQNGWQFIWGSNTEYEQDTTTIKSVIGQLYDNKLLNQSETRQAFLADQKLINRFFMMNTYDKYAKFLNLVELYNVELGSAPSLSQLSSWNLTNDVLAGAKVGDSANNTLSGGAAADVLIGGAGNDTLTGGGGADVFKFVSTRGGVDSITDFTSRTDKIEIVSQNFGNLAPGLLASTRFKYNAPATTNEAVFLYNGTSGVLSFDRDGTGSAAATQIATLTGSKRLFASDIQIVSA